MRKRPFRLVFALIGLPILLAQLLMLDALSQYAAAETPMTTIVYTSTTTLFPNPERGFYHHYETYSSNFPHPPISLTMLQQYRHNENISLILRLYYLNSFTNTSISPEYLNFIRQELGIVRQAGLKVILRFAYSKNEAYPNIQDASYTQVISHLNQLQPIFSENGDVIAVVQAGFIGAYGEWYAVHPDFGPPENPNFDTRGAVLFKLLEGLPPTRMVQLRTPRYKYNILSDTVVYSDSIPIVITPVNSIQAHQGSNTARTGHHNDCFLSSASDYGTYVYTPTELPYLQAETKYVVMGGETCDPGYAVDPDPSRLECQKALAEMERFHWSYLNQDWYIPTLQSWQASGCLTEIKQRLGYRFVLREGTYANEVSAGESFTFILKLQNEGWAAPFNPRLVKLLLRHTGDGFIYQVTLPDDPRFWLADNSKTYSLTYTICTPTDMPPGDYELLLHLPDPYRSLAGRSEYAIRFANEQTWEDSTGYNRLLHTLKVNAPTTNSPCNDQLPLEPLSLVFLPIILDSP